MRDPTHELDARKPVSFPDFLARVPAMKAANGRFGPGVLESLLRPLALLVGPANCDPMVVHAERTLGPVLLVMPEGEEDEEIALHELGHVIAARCAPTVELSDEGHEAFAEWFVEHVLDRRDPRAALRRTLDGLWDAYGEYGAVLFAMQRLGGDGL